MKKFLAVILFAFISLGAFAGGAKDKNSNPDFIASTSWTAAFADLAGIDDVSCIAPASLRHPPEYEITVSDIQKITESKYFIYAGFERMMQTLGNSVGTVQMVKISCDNSIATVKKNAALLSEITGTQEESAKRVAAYENAILTAARQLEELGLKGAPVLCNANQVYLAKDLGLTVAATFGPGPVTASQIADAKVGNYVFIIDNVHNPVGQPLAEVAPKSKYVIWRNFPEQTERNALLKVIEGNIKTLLGNEK